MKTRIENYNYLLTCSYVDAVTSLLEKYGTSEDDYYREESYTRFLKNEIKSITKGKYPRTSEGLYCHHIDENKHLNLSDKNFIFKKKYPFELQKKERLVFCDLFEHLILHTLIAKETNGEFGIPGYESCIFPMIVDWYIGEEKPQKEWMKNCFERAFLPSKETRILLKKTNSLLPIDFQKADNSPLFIVSDEERNQKLLELEAEWEEEQKKREQQEKEWEKERQERMEQERIRKEKENEQRRLEFNKTYPNFKNINVEIDTPRKEIIAKLYALKYNKTYKSIKEFDLSMKSFIRDELLDMLYSIIL